MGKSIAQMVAELPEDERLEVLKGFDMDALEHDWSFWGRPEQMFPDNDTWDVGLFLAGRGAGKTRSAAEWVREKAKITNRGQLYFLLVARTAADVRDVIVRGESGILSVSPPSERPTYYSSRRSLEWPNGNIAVLASADEPDSLRGPQAHFAWGDEVAAWRQPAGEDELSAWDNLRFATRLGEHPQIVATTTPRQVPMLRKLLLEEKSGSGKVYLTTGTTFENAGNLAANTLASLQGTYGGTRRGRQELMGEMLEAIAGALWTEEHIALARADSQPEYTPMRIIGVDPSVAENPGDYCGIVAVASTAEYDLYKRKAWVLEDASVKGAPEMWAKKVVEMAEKYACPVVAEVNQGGDLIRSAIQTINPNIKVLEVHARQGKQLRAEPVTLAYDQGRVKHWDSPKSHLEKLEEQMTTWIPGEGKSPDRVDALVHALTALLIKPPIGFSGGMVRARSMSDRRIGINQTTRRGPGGFGRGFSVR